MDEHVSCILTQCSQRIYIIKQLRNQGMDLSQLQIVVQALIISRILYALPARGGFLSVELINKIDIFLRRLKRYGYIECDYSITSMLHEADYDLFCKTRNASHCLHYLLPTPKISTSLRPRGHKYMLPLCTYQLHKQSFFVRCLFNFVSSSF